ncbi:MAG TPA: hypothetical protein V6D22_06960 [Candidatus Obscuribacterales bacterium]
MTEQAVKDAIKEQKLKCPKCQGPIKKYEKFSETIDSVQDGFNITTIDSRGSRVTLICGNEGCGWKERTEYWTNYLEDE